MKRHNVFVQNAESTPSFAALICNFSPASVRLETLEEKEYVVVPMVILTEGVHNGSSGPLYYPPEELSKTPVAWNHKPVVVYHPTMNGEPLSASEPHIINSRKVGLMMNTRWENGKLKSEAWLDRNKANKVDPRIMETVDKLETMELSTGVFLDIDKTAGNWNGEPYVGIARNFRADHLALLPDQVGACSLQDGAGLLRNARKEGLWDTFKRFLEEYKNVSNAETNKQTNNTMKKNEVIDAIINAKAGWTEEDRAALMGLNDQQLKIVQNSITPPAAPAPAAATPPPVPAAAAPAPAPAPAPAANAAAPAPAPKVVTVEDYIGAAPAGIQDVLRNAQSVYSDEKNRLIEAITKNANNGFTKQDLENRPLGELKNLARLAGYTAAPTPNYAGMAPTQTANASTVPALEVPAMNFDKK